MPRWLVISTLVLSAVALAVLVFGQKRIRSDDLVACRLQAGISAGAPGAWDEYLTVWGSNLERCLVEDHGWDSTDANQQAVLEIEEMRRLRTPAPDSVGICC